MAIKATDKVTVYDHTDTIKVVPWYHKQLRTDTTTPTITPGDMSPSGWTTTEPSVTSASDLNYKVFIAHQNVYGNNTCWWGDVSLYSSYEAAIQAYNKALDAGQIAEGKSKVFITDPSSNPPNPVAPYNVGDIWFKTVGEEDSEKVETYVCIQSESSTYSASHWELSATDDYTSNKNGAAIETINEQVTQLNENKNEQQTEIDGITKRIATAENTITYLNWTGYMRIYGLTDEPPAPVIQLGDPDYIENGYTLFITNSSMTLHQIVNNSALQNPLAYFGALSEGLAGVKAQNLEAENLIKIGKFVIETRNNNHMTIKWIGG